MKQITTVILCFVMLLSLAACGAKSPSPEEQAFEAACALLEEGKYQEAIDAFTALESYRQIQEKIDEAETALEAQRLADEQAARVAELEKIRHLLGTWKSEDGTVELTFREDMFCHYREWIEVDMTREIDYAYTLVDGIAYLESFPAADQSLKTDLGFAVTTEEREGVTHLLVGGFDFTLTEE